MPSAVLDQPDFAPYFRSRQLHSDDEEGMRATQQLRYRIYCLECGFLPAQAYPDELETDDYDARSSHFCAHNLNQELVGYVRLVRPDANGHLPFMDHCHELLPDVRLPPAVETAEISRLMVRADYRRRRGDLLAGVTAPEETSPAAPERRDPSPQILLSLYRRMYTLSLDENVHYWYAAMEKPLARALRSMGFGFQQIGPQTDYYGPVAPYLADLRDLAANVERANPALMRWLLQRGPATP